MNAFALTSDGPYGVRSLTPGRDRYAAAAASALEALVAVHPDRGDGMGRDLARRDRRHGSVLPERRAGDRAPRQRRASGPEPFRPRPKPDRVASPPSKSLRQRKPYSRRPPCPSSPCLRNHQRRSMRACRGRVPTSRSSRAASVRRATIRTMRRRIAPYSNPCTTLRNLGAPIRCGNQARVYSPPRAATCARVLSSALPAASLQQLSAARHAGYGQVRWPSGAIAVGSVARLDLARPVGDNRRSARQSMASAVHTR